MKDKKYFDDISTDLIEQFSIDSKNKNLLSTILKGIYVTGKEDAQQEFVNNLANKILEICK